MYVLAQRLVAPVGAASGINAFLHLHDEPRAPSSWQDIEYIADYLPGRLVAEDTELRPGGNRVLSYLEVAGPDDTLPQELGAILDEVRDTISDRSFVIVVRKHVSARFFLALRPNDVQTVAVLELAQLRERVNWLVAAHRNGATHPPDAGPPPLLVWRDLTEEGMTFSLDEASRQRLQQAVVQRVFQTTVRVDYVVHEDFEHQFGESFENLIPALVGIPHSKVIALGGVEVRDRATNQTLLKWIETS